MCPEGGRLTLLPITKPVRTERRRSPLTACRCRRSGEALPSLRANGGAFRANRPRQDGATAFARAPVHALKVTKGPATERGSVTLRTVHWLCKVVEVAGCRRCSAIVIKRAVREGCDDLKERGRE